MLVERVVASCKLSRVVVLGSLESELEELNPRLKYKGIVLASDTVG